MRKKSTHEDKESDEDNLDTSKFLSLDILFDLTKERNKAQLEQTDKLDSKANTILTSATAIVSACLILQEVLPSRSSHSLFTNFMVELPLIMLLIAYFTTMCSGFIVLMIHRYKLTPNPTRLYTKYLFKEKDYTKAKVLKSMIDDYRDNQLIVDNQIYWIKYSLVAIWIESIVFVVYLIVHTVL